MMSLDLMAVFWCAGRWLFSYCCVDASVECGWIQKESADTIWGAGLEDFGLIGAAYLLILILFSIRVFKFLKVVPYLLLK